MLLSDAAVLSPLYETDVLWRVLVPAIGSLLALAAGLGWSLLMTRQRSLDSRVAHIEKRLDAATTSDFCALQHASLAQHIQDVLRPITDQLRRLTNGTLESIISRVAEVESEVRTLRAVMDERHPRATE